MPLEWVSGRDRDNSKDKVLVKKKESEENNKRECEGKIETKRVSSGKLSSYHFLL